MKIFCFIILLYTNYLEVMTFSTSRQGNSLSMWLIMGENRYPVASF